jgi:hypothetical protein
MNRRTLLLLGGAAAVTLGGALLLTPRDATPPPPGQAALAFPDLATRLQQVARIEVKRHDGTLTVQRQGDLWVLPERAGYPARSERVRELLTGLTELRLTEPRTANPELLERLGLNDPTQPGSTASLLRVLDGEGRAIAELVIGRRRIRTQGNVPEAAFIRRANETQAWLAEGRLPIDGDPNLWLDRDIVNIARDRVQRVIVERAGEPPLALARAGEADAPLRVVQPALTPPIDETSLDEVGRAFEFLTFIEVKTEAEIPGEAVGASRFALTDNLTIIARVNRSPDAIWIRLAAEGDDEAARLNARWRGWAYQVGQWKERALVPRLADLQRQEEPAAPAPDPAVPPGAPGAPAAPAR